MAGAPPIVEQAVDQALDGQMRFTGTVSLLDNGNGSVRATVDRQTVRAADADSADVYVDRDEAVVVFDLQDDDEN